MGRLELIERNKNQRKYLKGMKFGRLEVIEEDGKDFHGFTYKCKCDCGNYKLRTKTNSLIMGRTQSCGCILKERKSTPEKVKQRILSNIKNVNGCWEWLCHTSKVGYGQIKILGKQKIAHRVSFEIFKGEIPEGKLVLHTCDNRKCVNPEHLYLGDHFKNMEDMVIKGRAKKQSNLEEKDVLEIRSYNGIKTFKELKEMFKISKTSIWKIMNRYTWKHV